MDGSLPGFSVHGILQARILEWIVIPFSRGSSLLDPGIEPGSPELQADSVPLASPDPLQCSCLENPRDGRAWWAAIYGVAQSRTRLSD